MTKALVIGIAALLFALRIGAELRQPVQPKPERPSAWLDQDWHPISAELEVRWINDTPNGGHCYSRRLGGEARWARLDEASCVFAGAKATPAGQPDKRLP